MFSSSTYMVSLFFSFFLVSKTQIHLEFILAFGLRKDPILSFFPMNGQPGVPALLIKSSYLFSTDLRCCL